MNFFLHLTTRTDCLYNSGQKNKEARKPLYSHMVRMRGLEPPRLATPDPKSGASANSATPAFQSTRSIILSAAEIINCVF